MEEEKYVFKKHIKITAEALAILVLLLATVSQVAAYGELTHYSINRDADKKSPKNYRGQVAPDAFQICSMEQMTCNSFVHMELPGVLYGPLDHYLYPSAGSPLQASQELWLVDGLHIQQRIDHLTGLI